jgi:hypothetical protein
MVLVAHVAQILAYSGIWRRAVDQVIFAAVLAMAAARVLSHRPRAWTHLRTLSRSPS